jgi:STE24 endopeptidase
MIASQIISLPLGLYSTFVIEEKHGFNKQSVALYFTDMIKGMLIGMALGLPLISAVLWVIRNGGPNFYFYVWLVM